MMTQKKNLISQKQEGFTKKRYSYKNYQGKCRYPIPFPVHNFNNWLSCFTFPTGMKYADVTPIHKKDAKTYKANYPKLFYLI